MRRVLFLAFLLSFLALTLAASDRSPVLKNPLDLPAGGGLTEEEEDVFEVIQFYGLEIEGDSFHFCFAAYEW